MRIDTCLHIVDMLHPLIVVVHLHVAYIYIYIIYIIVDIHVEYSMSTNEQMNKMKFAIIYMNYLIHRQWHAIIVDIVDILYIVIVYIANLSSHLHDVDI